ncbi:MAG: hypothetical protein AAGF99_00370 [Bacteroidota bacterium]
MTITKVKYNGKKLEVAFERLGESGLDEWSFVSRDTPRPEFIAAWDGLKTVAAKMLGGKPENHDVRGLSFHEVVRGSETEPGAILTTSWTLGWTKTPVTVNSPLSSFKQMPDRGAKTAIELVEAETKLFIEGKRAQTDLFASEEVEAPSDAVLDDEYDDGGEGLAKIAEAADNSASGDGAETAEPEAPEPVPAESVPAHAV